jgi:pimeloyl-ACP methyl ester carboxylesterase
MASNEFDESVRAPGPLLLALEWRAPWEYGASIASLPLLRSAPRGDGHPVLVFPGLAASDFSTLPLRRFLRDRGYAPHRWKQGMNLGPRPGVISSSLHRIRDLHHRYGKKVSLIGWSLGGVYARELAKLAPDDVRFVITLGTPFKGNPKATNAWRLYELASGHRVDDARLHTGLHEAPPVPTTSIYSRTDGVVAWQCSVQDEGPLAENIEVQASHVGMGMNPMVFFAIADRLAQPDGQWKPFDRSGLRKFIYRNPRRKHLFDFI